MKRLSWLGIFLVSAGVARGASGPPATAAAQAVTTEALIEKLGDSDPAVREQAAQRLIWRGPAVRGALIAASASPRPAIRSAAAGILLRLPWYSVEDPAPVREALKQYGAMAPGDRQTAVRTLAGLAGPGAVPQAWGALIRLLGEEPNPEVRWSIVTALRGDHREKDLQQLRMGPVEDVSSPALVVRGWAWLAIDRAKALALFEQAVALEAEHPTQDNGAMNLAFDLLVRHDLAQGKYDAAAALLRQQALRDPTGPGEGQTVSKPLFSLFALHAEHGPLAGFGQDVGRFAPLLGRPALIYAMGKLYARAGQPMVARALEEAAYAADSASPGKRLNVAELLMGRRWYGLAERELNGALAESANAPGALDGLAHLKLQMIAVACGNDFEAARHLQSVLEGQLTVVRINQVTGESTAMDNQALWAEVYWRYARAARAQGDQAAMNKQLDALLALHPDQPDLAQELVPMLKQVNRAQDAATVFDAAYKKAKGVVEASKEDPEAMNNLAWLCARCDQRLEEARMLAKRAVELSPDNAAYLDTAAEVNFRLGHKAEAIRLEQRALQLQPGNTFMRKQLERFSE